MPGTVRPCCTVSDSIGVTPIQCRWNTFTSPGSRSESAYCGTFPELVGPSHHADSKRICIERARVSAHTAVATSPLLRAMSARSHRPRIV